MASTQHTPTELEAAGDLVLPAADELAGRFPLTSNAHPATPEEYNEIMSTLAFGKKFTDHMAHMRWTREGGWDDRGVIPYGPLELTPAPPSFTTASPCSRVSRPTSVRTAPCGPSAPATTPRA